MSADDLPQYFTWNAETSVMVPRNRKLADRTYVDGEMYRLGVIEERSANSHSHYFAALHDAWANLPDREAERFPTVEHLRKRALIDAGFFNETIIDCSTNAAALRVASHLRARDDFAVVIVRGPAVVERTAKSQSMRAMGKEDFQRSKQAVLDIVSELIGTTPKELQRNAESVA